MAGCLVDRSATPPRVRALVVAYIPECSDRSYAVGSGETNHVVIDLDADGEPVWPFAYRGDKKEPDDVWKDLPEEQRTALSSVHFGHGDFEQGAKAVRSRDFVPANREGFGIHAGTMLDSTQKHPLTFYLLAGIRDPGGCHSMGERQIVREWRMADRRKAACIAKRATAPVVRNRYRHVLRDADAARRSGTGHDRDARVRRLGMGWWGE